jgi:hypothetical protein
MATGTLVADCASCRDWQGSSHGRIAVCRMTDGVTHAAPEMWIASRSQRLQHERRLGALDAYAAAWADWSANCEMQR